MILFGQIRMLTRARADLIQEKRPYGPHVFDLELLNSFNHVVTELEPTQMCKNANSKWALRGEPATRGNSIAYPRIIYFLFLNP